MRVPPALDIIFLVSSYLSALFGLPRGRDGSLPPRAPRVGTSLMVVVVVCWTIAAALDTVR